MGGTPAVVVSGPVRNEAGINYQTGVLGSGTRANASIGRTLKLILHNIGGARLGGTESTTIGGPTKYRVQHHTAANDTDLDLLFAWASGRSVARLGARITPTKGSQPKTR